MYIFYHNKKKNVSKTTQEWASSTLIQKISTLEPLVNSAVFSPACQPQHAPLSFRDAKWQLLKHVSGSLGRRPRRSPERDNDIEAKPLEWSISSLTSEWVTQLFSRSREPSVYQLVFPDIPVYAKTITTDILVHAKIMPFKGPYVPVPVRNVLNRNTTLKNSIIIPIFKRTTMGARRVVVQGIQLATRIRTRI